ncbi:MAG TPA: THUMP domain-containing protein [Gammaproteobacteria bacterium]|nr:THUMP domain-containing protein [Gammaproteobacteria bacterium]
MPAAVSRKPPVRAERHFFATAARGLEPLVADELRALGAHEVNEARGGASFSGPLAIAYGACLWLRTANRVLMPLARFPAPDADRLYTAVTRMPWENDLSPDGTLAVDFTGSNENIIHTGFGAQRVKDAIVDRFRETSGRRPSVNVEQPDLRINVHLHRDITTVSLDLSGDSLHQRGYRIRGVAAPLKETLAAALLLKCGWPEIGKQGGTFVDPMCGSGTLAIEAALIAGDVAPGLWRTRWGFSGWRKHDPQLWDHMLQEARRRRDAGRGKIPVILGMDPDPQAIAAAKANAERAGLMTLKDMQPPSPDSLPKGKGKSERSLIHFERRALADNVLSTGLTPGLVVTNPPYGERLGEAGQLGPLYVELGRWLRSQCPGWRAGVITDNRDLAKQIGVRARKINTFYNGALECRLLQFDIEPEWFMRSTNV